MRWLINGGDQEQRADAPGRAHVPQARADRAGRRRRLGTIPGRFCYEKELSFQVSCSYGQGVTTRSMRKGAGLSRGLRALDGAAQLRGGAGYDGGADGWMLHRSSLTALICPMQRRRTSSVAKGGSSLGILLKYPGVAEQSHESLRTSTVRSSCGFTDEAGRAGRFGRCGIHRLGQLCYRRCSFQHSRRRRRF